jgi:peptide/nickel transport system substrate-binding protein
VSTSEGETMSSRTRRLWLRLSVIVAVLGLVAASCAGGDDSDSEGSGADDTADADEPDTETGAEEPDTEGEGDLRAPEDTVPEETDADSEDMEPQPGGTLRVAVEAESDGLNPTANNFAQAAYIMVAPVFDPYVYFDPEGNVFPYLAESFTASEDNTAWQMKLREGVLFHDRTELDADDVIASFEAQLADPIVSLAIRYRFPEAGAIEKIDQYTVQYNLARPEAEFPVTLHSQLGYPVPSEFLAAAAEDASLSQRPPGTGPFMIESRTEDEVTVLTRFDDYWGADQHEIYLDRIEVYPITDPTIAAERLSAGDLDIVVTDNAEAILTLREAEGVATIENVRADEEFAMLNTARPPFDDIRARQAITHATDRDAYIALIAQETAPPADTMFHPDLIWNNPDVVQQTNSPELAGPLVESYCADLPENCTDGKIDVELQYSGPSVLQTRIAELLIDNWEDYFNVEQDELLQDEHILEVAVGQYNVVTWRQFGEPAPVVDTLWINCDVIGGISLNWPRYCDEERQALIDEVVATADVDRQVEIWREIQELIAESYTYIFFHHTNWTVGTRDNVHNVCGQTAPDGTALFCNNQGRIMLHQIWLG